MGGNPSGLGSTTDLDSNEALGPGLSMAAELSLVGSSTLFSSQYEAEEEDGMGMRIATPQLRASSQEAKPLDNDEQPSVTGSFRVHTPGTKRRGSAVTDDETVFIQEDGLGLRVQSSRGTSGDDSASPTNMRRVGTRGGGASGGSDSEGGIGGVNSADERPLTKGAGVPSSVVSGKPDLVGRPIGPTIEARVRTGHENSVGVPPRTAAGGRAKIVSTPAGGTRQANNAHKDRPSQSAMPRSSINSRVTNKDTAKSDSTSAIKEADARKRPSTTPHRVQFRPPPPVKDRRTAIAAAREKAHAAVSSELSSSKVVRSLDNLHPKLRSSPLSGPARPFTSTGGARASPKTPRLTTAPRMSRPVTKEDAKRVRRRPEWNNSTLDTLYTPRRDRDLENNCPKQQGSEVTGGRRRSSEPRPHGPAEVGSASARTSRRGQAVGDAHPASRQQGGRVGDAAAGPKGKGGDDRRSHSPGPVPPRNLPPARGGEDRGTRNGPGRIGEQHRDMSAGAERVGSMEEESGGEATIPAGLADLERPQSRRGDPSGAFLEGPIGEAFDRPTTRGKGGRRSEEAQPEKPPAMIIDEEFDPVGGDAGGEERQGYERIRHDIVSYDDEDFESDGDMGGSSDGGGGRRGEVDILELGDSDGGDMSEGYGGGWEDDDDDVGGGDDDANDTEQVMSLWDQKDALGLEYEDVGGEDEEDVGVLGSEGESLGGDDEDEVINIDDDDNVGSSPPPRRNIKAMRETSGGSRMGSESGVYEDRVDVVPQLPPRHSRPGTRGREDGEGGGGGASRPGTRGREEGVEKERPGTRGGLGVGEAEAEREVFRPSTRGKDEDRVPSRPGTRGREGDGYPVRPIASREGRPGTRGRRDDPVLPPGVGALDGEREVFRPGTRGKDDGGSGGRPGTRGRGGEGEGGRPGTRGGVVLGGRPTTRGRIDGDIVGSSAPSSRPGTQRGASASSRGDAAGRGASASSRGDAAGRGASASSRGDADVMSFDDAVSGGIQVMDLGDEDGEGDRRVVFRSGGGQVQRPGTRGRDEGGRPSRPGTRGRDEAEIGARPGTRGREEAEIGARPGTRGREEAELGGVPSRPGTRVREEAEVGGGGRPGTRRPTASRGGRPGTRGCDEGEVGEQRSPEPYKGGPGEKDSVPAVVEMGGGEVLRFDDDDQVTDVGGAEVMCFDD